MYKILLFICLISCACSTTSTLTRVDGTIVEGKLSRIDGKTVRVKTTENGQEVLVNDSEVADIDHPGNVHFLTGSILSGFGVAIALGTIPLFLDTDDPYSALVGYLNLGVASALISVGAPIAIWGAHTWGIAKTNLANQTLSLQPTIFDTQGFSPGLNVKLRF